MRYLKKLLIAVYVYLAMFATACFVAWYIKGIEPAALIAGVCGAAGVESIIAGLMKLYEIKDNKNSVLHNPQGEEKTDTTETIINKRGT